MGLDAVELVLEVEDAFEIQIPDEEAAGILTVGDLCDYVCAKIDIASGNAACLSAAAFYQLRSAAKSLGQKERLRPRDKTARLLPATGRRRFWASLQQESGLKLPALSRPEWVVLFVLIATAVAAVTLGSVTLHATDSVVAMLATAFAAFFAAAGIGAVITRPLAVLPGRGCRTIRGLAERTLELNLPLLSKQYGGAHKNDVWVTLQRIIVDQLGVRPEEVTPSASFVNDLGCD